MGQQIHDKYGKSLIRTIARSKFVDSGDLVRVQYQGGISATIDGVITGCCAIEIESRVAKQVRGALLDLLYHPLTKKLLILIPAHMSDPEGTAEHCREILDRYRRDDEHIEVVLLRGTGHEPKPDEDRRLIGQALRRVGCLG
jgi:hypothetical protein